MYFFSIKKKMRTSQLDSLRSSGMLFEARDIPTGNLANDLHP